MQHASVVAIFCEDIREERSGQDTIVGTMPDNVNIARPQLPPGEPWLAALPRLSLYLRINFDSEDKIPRAVTAKMVNTDGKDIASSSWERSVIERAFAAAKESKMPLVGLIAKIVGGPFAIPKSGQILAIATIDDDEYIAGAINLIVPSVSVPPA